MCWDRIQGIYAGIKLEVKFQVIRYGKKEKNDYDEYEKYFFYFK